MPVTNTTTPNAFRVSFLEVDKSDPSENSLFQSEIICVVRALDTGKIEINYAHHIQRSRNIPTGPWKEKVARMPINPSLSAFIASNVMHELWCRLFDGKIQNITPDLAYTLDLHEA